MVSSKALNRILITGIVLIAGCGLVFAYPSITEDDEKMMGDEYDYDVDDQSNPSQQTKPSSISKASIPEYNRSVTVRGTLDEDVVLKCDAKITKDSVILWYQGKKIISSGNNVVLPNFNLDPETFDLTILKASPQNAGDYYCELLPEKVHLHTKVVLGDHSFDVITPESSTSAQSSLHRFTCIWLLLTSVGLGLQHYYKH